jgi:hypothetical protein
MLLTGCAAVAPLQTASVVEAGHTRIGAQGSAALFCGPVDWGLFAVLGCNQYPDGVPLPELRLAARRGLGSSTDVGASLRIMGQVAAPEHVLEAGATFEAKRELLHVTHSGLQHVVSAGALAGVGLAGRLGLAPTGTIEWGLPLFYGLQTKGLEWVVGVSFSSRIAFGGSPGSATQVAPRFDATVGVFAREPFGWSVQLGYLTEPRQPGRGALQLQFGWLWDIANEPR